MTETHIAGTTLRDPYAALSGRGPAKFKFESLEEGGAVDEDSV